MKEYVEKIKDHPELLAYRCMDEPGINNWTAPIPWIPTNENDKWGKTSINLPFYFNLIKSTDPHHPIYFNMDVLTPTGFSSYYEYLEYINNIITPDLWCYDFYPYRGDGNVVSSFERDVFFKNSIIIIKFPKRLENHFGLMYYARSTQMGQFTVLFLPWGRCELKRLVLWLMVLKVSSIGHMEIE